MKLNNSEWQREQLSETQARVSDLEGERDEARAECEDARQALREHLGEIERTLRVVLASVASDHWQDPQVRVQVVALLTIQLTRVAEELSGGAA